MGQLTRAPFVASSSVRANVTLESLQLFKEQLQNYKATFTEEDLETTKNLLLKQATRNFETLGSLLGVMSNVSRFDLPLDFIEQDLAELQSLTLESVHGTIDRYMNEQRMIYVVVGDGATQRARVAQLGYGPPLALDVHGRPIGGADAAEVHSAAP